MKCVHGDRQCLVSFLGDGTIGHCARLKAGHDRIHALHFLKRNAFLRIVEFQLASQVDLLAFRVYHFRVFFEHIIISASCGLLEHMDRLRVVKVFLPAALEFMSSETVKGHISVQSQRIECLCMECGIILGDLLNADSSHTADCIRKVSVDELFLQSDRLEDLGSLIGLDR